MQVDVRNVASGSQRGYLVDVVGLEQQSGKAAERAATNAHTTYVAYFVAVAAHERGASTHADDYHSL